MASTPKEQAESAKKTLKREKEKMRRVELAALRKAGGIFASATYGLLNRLGVPVAIGPVPIKLPVWGVSQLVEIAAPGMVGSFFGGVADASLNTYTERAISGNTFIAGELPSGDDDDDEIDAALLEEGGGDLD